MNLFHLTSARREKKGKKEKKFSTAVIRIDLDIIIG